VAGCCEYGDEPSGSGATELVVFMCDRENGTVDSDLLTAHTVNVSFVMTQFKVRQNVYSFKASLNWKSRRIIQDLWFQCTAGSANINRVALCSDAAHPEDGSDEFLRNFVSTYKITLPQLRRPQHV
jgi:hypothetical protein